MFQNAALDVAIGLVLMYLMLSLTCTVINEYIASKLKLRSKALEAGLKELLDDPNVRGAFYQHGSIAALTNAATKASGLLPMKAAAAPAGTHPAYLSAETFVFALVGSLSRQGTPGQEVPGFAQVQAAIQNLPSSRLKDSLITSLTVAEGNFASFRKNVATWFDDSMDRLTGAYKRNLKFISIVVGCAVACCLNADTIEVGRSLWSDSGLRAQMIQAAEATTKASMSESKTAETQIVDITSSYEKASKTLRPLPIGWPVRDEFGPAWSWLLRIAGWFMTGLALSFGAPFWFDALSKFMNLRAAGVKPERQT